MNPTSDVNSVYRVTGYWFSGFIILRRLNHLYSLKSFPNTISAVLQSQHLKTNSRHDSVLCKSKDKDTRRVIQSCQRRSFRGLDKPKSLFVTTVLLVLPTRKEVHRSMCTNASLTRYLFNFCFAVVLLFYLGRRVKPNLPRGLTRLDRDLGLHNEIVEKQTFST